MSFTAILDRYATLSRQVVTKGTSGEDVKTFNNALAQIKIAIVPVSAKIRNEYAVIDQVVTHKIITTTNLDTATSLLGGPLGGAKIGDRWNDGRNTYLVQDYYAEENFTISREGLYVSVCQLIRP
jgi:hypothetical protein